MSRTREINRRFIRRQWRKLNFAEKFQPFFDGEISLNKRKIRCLKDSYKSSIWKLEIQAGQKTFPLILKISKQLRHERPESTVERNISRKAKKVLQPFMPKIYLTKKNINGHDLWVFMEYIESVNGRLQYSPDHFAKIIPALAKLHAATINERFKPYEELFAGWLPRYNSREMMKERIETNNQTVYYLKQAMKIPNLRELLHPHYRRLLKLLAKGPGYFPEVGQSGMCIIHGDLHTNNMVCHNLRAKDWGIQFIDWEGAKLAPCWYDLVSLIGIFLAYRREWADQEETITRRSIRLYAKEMEKNGVVFNSDPLLLYQKAYLKRILEKSLYLQLNWAVTGKKEAKLLPVYLEKIKVLSEKTGLC